MNDIQHFPNEQRFVLEFEGAQAVLQYALSEANGISSIDFNSTFVPLAFRGKGLAEQLVRAGIKWAKEQGYELHASCWYAEKFLTLKSNITKGESI